MTHGSSPEGVVVEDLAEGVDETEVALDVAGPAQVTIRRITIAPGGSTGEHYHHGQLITIIERGVLTHCAPIHHGGVRQYRAGDAVVEDAGYAHEGRNEGDEPVVMWATYITPWGEPLAEPGEPADGD